MELFCTISISRVYIYLLYNKKEMKRTITLLLFIAIGLMSQISMAVPAYKGLVQLSQPDGTEISAYLFGDERLSWVESEDNYTLMYNQQGYLEYAIKNQDGDMIPSGVIAKNQSERSISDINFLSTIEKRLRYSEPQVKIMLQMTEMLDNSKAQGIEGLTIGIRKLLVILVQYSDSIPGETRFTYTRQDFEDLFNQIGYSANGATGSVRDYFAASSFGKLDLQCTIVGPVTLLNDRAFYGARTANDNDANAAQMIIDACYAADSVVDFTTFDNDGNLTVDGVHIVYAGKGEHNGGGNNAIWAHRSKLSLPLVLDGVRIVDYSCASEKNTSNDISGIGVHSHEFGHVLGVLDYYDTNKDIDGVSKTLGDLDIMDAGTYNNNEKTPPLYNAFTRVYLGWASPYIIDSTMLMDITSIPNQDTALIFKINTPNEGEYFILENINFSGWNSFLHTSINSFRNNTGTNSAIRAFHIDESASSTGWGLSIQGGNCVNCVAIKNNVLLMSADGNYNGNQTGQIGKMSWYYTNMANMLYPGSQNITSLTDTTTTNLKSWGNQNSNVAITNITRLANDNITFKVNGGAALGVQVQTFAPTQITFTSAKLSGSTQTSLQGDTTVIERGFVYSTDPYPLVSNNKLIVAGTIGSFDTTLTGLVEGKTYYYRAYGINANGVAYGEHFSFLTNSDPISNNSIVDSNFAACETGEMPTILGSVPQGGSGEYTYRWLESTDNINWTITQNAGIRMDYTPSTMAVPMYFKRVVLSADKVDTSASKYVPIVPVTVVGTISKENDTISENSSTGPITLSGQVGDVVVWQRKFGTQQWERVENSAFQTSISEILTQEGDYQYRVRVRSGACPSKNSTPVTIVVSNDIGLYGIELDQINFNIYPNPSKGEFTLDLGKGSGKEVDMQIVDLLGKTVYIKNNLKERVEINVSNIEDGTYILILKEGDKIVGRKQLVITK